METTILTDIISLLCGGGLGAFISQLYAARMQRKKAAIELADASADAERKKQDNKQDAFDTMYQQLNKCMNDYATISEEYREYREKARKQEESIEELIHNKCLELATLKSKVTFLKGIRCYDTSCPNRIKTDPDKEYKHQESEESK